MTHVGDNGLALSMKIAINLSLAVQMLAFSEGVLLAEKSGIPRETAVDVLTHSVIGSPMVQYRGPLVLNMPDEAWFDVNMMQKDMLLALEMGRQLDVPLPTTAVDQRDADGGARHGARQEGLRGRLRGAGADVRSPEMSVATKKQAGADDRHRASTGCFTCTGRWWPSACSRSGSTISTRAR